MVKCSWSSNWRLYLLKSIYVDGGDWKKDILAELADATNDISQGELIQLDAISNIKISLNKLKKISYFKTGRLFEASAKTGAMLAGANKNFIKNIGESAKNIGILFQIKDDLLDYSNSFKNWETVFSRP